MKSSRDQQPMNINDREHYPPASDYKQQQLTQAGGSRWLWLRSATNRVDLYI